MRSYIRELDENDIKLLDHIDNQYSRLIAEELKFLEDLKGMHFYGIFIEYDTLIGFCSVGPADDVPSSEYWTQDSILISDFYILEKYRNNGYGSELLTEVLNLFSNSSSIFFEADSNIMAEFCIKLGFKDCNDGFLVLLSNKEDK